MTDLSALAAQPQQQQVVMPNILAPVSIGTEPVQVPGGAGHVAITVYHQHGAFVFGVPARDAIEFGKRVLAAGRAALTGLTIVGDVGADTA